MRKKLFIVLLLASAVFVFASCVWKEPAPQGDFQLYFVTNAGNSKGEDAIGECAFDIPESETMTTQELAQQLLEALLSPPDAPLLSSPFPNGTRLQELSISGKRALVNFNAAYSRLSGIDLSLADYCVVLTLTQLDGINAVTITANGYELPYRKTQLLTAADPLLSSREDALRPITVQLYFLDTETGELRAQQQTLALYEGQTRVNALVDAMLAGPENDSALRCLLPAEFSVISSRIEEGICYLNLPSDVPLPADEREEQLMLDALVQSLCSLTGVEQVQLMLDGEIVETLGTVRIEIPLPETDTE